ncbi:hypothetical protein EFB08_02730 [Rufibacter latericius]|uniref:Uncharacterized protein n=1 Tax=Rufibacter latericius TaxID=2487040 RepID=A0A3M9N2R0_9BACT|nr:hypothetical protein EFB08_02730 [Rufibacter latericius]
MKQIGFSYQSLSEGYPWFEELPEVISDLEPEKLLPNPFTELVTVSVSERLLSLPKAAIAIPAPAAPKREYNTFLFFVKDFTPLSNDLSFLTLVSLFFLLLFFPIAVAFKD